MASHAVHGPATQMRYRPSNVPCTTNRVCRSPWPNWPMKIWCAAPSKAPPQLEEMGFWVLKTNSKPYICGRKLKIHFHCPLSDCHSTLKDRKASELYRHCSILARHFSASDLISCPNWRISRSCTAQYSLPQQVKTTISR